MVLAVRTGASHFSRRPGRVVGGQFEKRFWGKASAMSGSFPDGMSRGESLNPPRREQGVWARRVFITIVLVFLVLGLLNVFGQSTSTSEASSDAAGLGVSAPSALRAGLLYQVEIEVRARRTLASPTLSLSSGWFSGLTTNAEVPQPSTQSSRNGETIFTLGPMRPGDVRHVRIYFQVNPTTVAWNRGQDVTLLDGGTPLVTLHRTVNVYP